MITATGWSQEETDSLIPEAKATYNIGIVHLAQAYSIFSFELPYQLAI
jgi:hypothetical protein